jgi:hypothetical protein
MKGLWVLVWMMGMGGSLWAADLQLQVVDLQGAAIPGATVDVRDLAGSKITVTVVADATGRVKVSTALPAEIRVTATGFDPLVQRLETGAASEMALRLRPATIRTTVDVAVQEAPGSGPQVGSALQIDRSGARKDSAFSRRKGILFSHEYESETPVL